MNWLELSGCAMLIGCSLWQWHRANRADRKAAECLDYAQERAEEAEDMIKTANAIKAQNAKETKRLGELNRLLREKERSIETEASDLRIAKTALNAQVMSLRTMALHPQHDWTLQDVADPELEGWGQVLVMRNAQNFGEFQEHVAKRYSYRDEEEHEFCRRCAEELIEKLNAVEP